jgi:hypothetical protein
MTAMDAEVRGSGPRRECRRAVVAGAVFVVLFAALSACGSTAASVSTGGVPTTVAVFPGTSSFLSLATPGVHSGCPSAACAAVLKLVAAASSITKIPSDLQPQLQDAAKDLLRPTGLRCVQLPQFLDSNPCTRTYSSNPSAPMMVLLGDSHAWMWSTTVASIAQRTGYNFTLIYKSSCKIPLVAFADTPGGPSNAQCTQWKNAAIAWINQNHPKLVLVAASDHTPTASDGKPMGQHVYSDGLASLLEKVSAKGRRVVILGDIPELSQDPPTCLAAHESSAGSCSTPVEDAAPVDKQGAEVAAALKAGASFIYVVPWFCTTSTCPAVIGSFDVYQDDYHATSTYANSLSEVLQHALNLTK